MQWNINNYFEHDIDISLWDFAGQTQYYGLHQSFFSNRCLFILVVDSRHQQSPYDWLEQISLISENQADVLIFINRYEYCPSQLNINDIQTRFKNINIVGNRVFEVDLGAFHGYCIHDDSLESKEDYNQLKGFLKTLVASSKSVQTEMNVDTFKFYNEVEKLIESHKYCFGNSELREIAKKHNQQKSYTELVSAFGNLVRNNRSKTNPWLSAQWLNQTGYELLSFLHSNKPQLYYNHEDIIDRVESNEQITIDDEACDRLLEHFYQSNLAIEDKTQGNSKVIIPAILPTDDPDFLLQLNKQEKYRLYASFDIHIDFMQMGLFSQWLVQWLSLSKESDNVVLKDTHYSRHCCILTSTTGESDVYLAIKWHPHYRNLLFSFYYQTVDDLASRQKRSYLKGFKMMLVIALKTIFKYQETLRIQEGFTVRKDLAHNDEMVNRFVNDLEKISEKGLINYYFNSMTQGGVTVGGDYYKIEQGGLRKAGKDYIEASDNATVLKAGGDININTQQQENYLNALDELEAKFKAKFGDDPQEVENVTKVIEFAKDDIEAGKLTEEKKGFFETVADGINKANPILTYVSGLYTLYGAAAGI